MIWSNRKGNVAVMATFFISIAGMLCGLSIDFSRFVSARQQLQSAVDAATVRAANMLLDDPKAKIEKLRQQAKRHVEKNFPGVLDSGFQMEQGCSNEVKVKRPHDICVTLTAYTKTKAYFGAFIPGSKGQVRVSWSSSIQAAPRINFELAMALDNSGSMADSLEKKKMSTLQSSVKNMIKVLLPESQEKNLQQGTKKISLIPFSLLVNIGKDDEQEKWTTRESPDNSVGKSFLVGKTEKKGIIWKGCVKARRDALKLSSASGSPKIPRFLSPPGKSYSPGSALIGKRKTLHNYFNILGERCTTQPLVPLTEDPQKLLETIEAMKPAGETDTSQGALWALHTLAPQIPFPSGTAFKSKKTQKFMLIFTDGYNTYSPKFGSAYGTDKEMRNKGITQRKQFKRVCSLAKKQGVTIYTIAFDLDEMVKRAQEKRKARRDEYKKHKEQSREKYEAWKNLKAAKKNVKGMRSTIKRVKGDMRTCASSPDNYIYAVNADDLETAFKKITRNIMKLSLKS